MKRKVQGGLEMTAKMLLGSWWFGALELHSGFLLSCLRSTSLRRISCSPTSWPPLAVKLLALQIGIFVRAAHLSVLCVDAAPLTSVDKCYHSEIW